MQNIKKGLRLVSIPVVIQIIWTLVYVVAVTIAPSINNAMWQSFLVQLPIITLALTVACFVISLIGLFVAGEDHRSFITAGKFKAASLLLSILSLIFAVSAVMFRHTGNDNIVKISQTIIMVADITTLVFEIAVLFSVVRSCVHLAYPIRKVANFAIVLFIIETLIMITFEVLVYLNRGVTDEATLKFYYPIIITLAVAYAIFAIGFSISYLRVINAAIAKTNKK